MMLLSHPMLRQYLIFLFVSFTLAGPLRADVASVLPLGDLDQWAALTLGYNRAEDRLFNSAQIYGNVGVSGNRDLNLTSASLVDGDVYLSGWGAARSGQGAMVNGSQFRGANAFLNTERNLALNLSRAAGLLTPTRNVSMINLSATDNLTLSGAPGETVVLNLRMIRMSGSSTLTLQGSADTTYVINVNRGFSLTDTARIVLSGGLDWNDVVFNVRGTGTPVSIAGNSTFQGILLATRRTAQLRDAAILRGEAIADNLQMQGTSQIVHPPVVSP